MEEPEIEILAEGERFNIWRAAEPDGEMTYHLELGIATLHLFQEEWDEFLQLVEEAQENAAEG
jgi:hypothetical protein